MSFEELGFSGCYLRIRYFCCINACGRGSGFLCSVVVLVVGWFVARLKWGRVGTRREEIRRLMALASEEAARAELEAATGYSSYGFGLATEPIEEEPAIGSGLSPGRQFQYQCEVCFCPTTTRCKRCKAVHYWKHAILDVLSVENECAHRFAACPSENSGYVQNARSGTKPSARKAVDQLRGSNFIRHGSLGAGGGVMGGDEGSFSYELFVKLYNWKIVELRPCGLINCGNSCYANSVLQCLAFTPPLTAYFLQGLHSKACGKKEWCFTCEFEVLVKKAKEGSSPLSPACIMPQMQRIGSHLGNGTEEDAHEFLRYAIDAMQSVCLKEAGVKVPRSLDEETTLMGLTFGGYLRSKIECMRCGGKSEQQERIMDLTVEIGGYIGTLEEALRQFTHSEFLEGENKYYCGRCKSYEKAKKKLRVLEAPNVLTISLKRFESGKFGKLNKAVYFPEILNLAPFMSGTSDKSSIYFLL